ncbi:MAG: hypothetical protein FWG87_13995 [Defluviitaleaceae bacterium]|nr:hypothetical protein [Defluviitaleaceae bacterium]
MSKPIDFCEQFEKLEEGEFFGYPIEDSVIHAFNITDNEIKKYMHPKYFGKPWTFVFEAIMSDRERKGNGNA